MPDVRYTLVDVFAARPLEGNLLPVIEGADLVPGETQATLARRFNLSETSFLLGATSPSATYQHRIYLTSGEIPFAGHPSLGTAAVWAYRNGLTDAEVVQQTLSGEQRIHVALNGRHGRATIWQNPGVAGETYDPATVMAAVGLPVEAAHPRLPLQAYSTGLPTLFAPLADPSWLAEIRLDRDRLGSLVGDDASLRPVTIYLVAESGPGAWAARSFGMEGFFGEDPATGSAAGAFGAYLQKHTGERVFRIRQGVEMKAPSELFVDTADGIAVSGEVHIVGEGTLYLPD